MLPRYDGTGPYGYGPLTGRGFGFCAGHPGWHYGAGYGRRLGRRRGWGPGYGYGPGPGFAYGFAPAAPWHWGTAKSEKEFLEEERDLLQVRLKEIEEELEEFDE